MAPVQKKVKTTPAPAKTASPAPATTASPVHTPETRDSLRKKRVHNKKKRVEGENFKLYIHRVLKQVHPNMGISTRAMSTMDSFVSDMFERIVTEAARVVKNTPGKTLSSQAIETAVRLVLPGEIASHAISEGNKAVLKYNQTTEK